MKQKQLEKKYYNALVKLHQLIKSEQTFVAYKFCKEHKVQFDFFKELEKLGVIKQINNGYPKKYKWIAVKPDKLMTDFFITKMRKKWAEFNHKRNRKSKPKKHRQIDSLKTSIQKKYHRALLEAHKLITTNKNFVAADFCIQHKLYRGFFTELSRMGIIEKTKVDSSRKYVYEWVGEPPSIKSTRLVYSHISKRSCAISRKSYVRKKQRLQEIPISTTPPQFLDKQKTEKSKEKEACPLKRKGKTIKKLPKLINEAAPEKQQNQPPKVENKIEDLVLKVGKADTPTPENNYEWKAIKDIPLPNPAQHLPQTPKRKISILWGLLKFEF